MSLLIAGSLLLFLAPFLFLHVGPLIIVQVAVGALLLREAIRLWRSPPTGRTMAAMLVALVVTWYLATLEGGGPPLRAIAMVGLAASVLGAWLVLQALARVAE